MTQIKLPVGTVSFTPVRKNPALGVGGGGEPPPPPPTCFLKDSLVLMANSEYKAIQDVEAGDFVVGAFGEINEVLALDRTILGTRHLYRINNEHSTTAEHPHVSTDKKFYAQDVESTYNEYGTTHRCLTKNEKIQNLTFHGVKPGRVQSLKLGIELQKVDGGSIVKTVEKYKLPDSTLLFNLIVSGSHTYFVNNYAVSGWVRDDDFDYDSWTAIDVPKVTAETYNYSRNKILA
jgi:hypothetical protein